ncbi:MAG: PAQR family membrane homeostasis protein TrhA [Gaiellaceae bacterium]
MAAAQKPRLRGVFHEWAFFAAIPLGIVLGVEAHGQRAIVSAWIFATSVVLMFGASALYHRVNWSPRRRILFRRLDHIGIYGLIAGTYTPVGLITLRGAWRWSVLGVVWGGALVAAVVKMSFPHAPKWVAASIALALGWVGVLAFPQIASRLGAGGATLILLGGLCYTLGAVIYARRRPDPAPGTFGYHEIFHLLVVAAVALQYVAVAFFVLRSR